MDTGDNTARREPRDLRDRAAPLIAAHRHRPGALLPMLHAIRDEFGYVPPQVVPDIAAALNLSRAEVHGVITFYHDFRQTPPGRHVVQVCRAEACQACGADALMDAARETLGCEVGATRDDGAVTLEAAWCLGLCASSPAVRIGDRLHARVTPERLRAIAAGLGIASGAHPPSGTADPAAAATRGAGARL